MFKQSSKTHFTLLIIAAACVLFAAGSVTAQFKGYKSVFKTPIDISKDALLNEAVDIDQCANGGVGDPPEPCSGAGWVNGNLGASKSHCVEGDSVAYRDVFTGLTSGSSYTVTIEYDTTKSGKHALDYLTSFDRTETLAMGNNPCSGVTGCTLGTFTTATIPVDPKVTAGQDQVPANGDDIAQLPGVFTLFSGTINGVSAYSYSGSYAGDSSTRISITFTANASSVVLAWGGHIGTRLNWGINNSAVAISGSPYHMRNFDFSAGNIGQQDRSLSAEAVFFPAAVAIVKVADVPGGVTGQGFDFSANAAFGTPLTFTLFDNGVVGADRTSRSYTIQPGEIQVVEGTVTNWSLTSVSCSIVAGGGPTVGTAVGSVGSRQATINLQEANLATCTFTNTFAGPTAATATVSGRVMTPFGVGIRGALVTVFDASSGASRTAITNNFGSYTFKDLQVDSFYVMNVSAKRYTFTNNQQSFVIQGDLANINFTSDQ